MGCLFDVLFEFIFEVVGSILIEGIFGIGFKLMTLVVPEDKISPKLQDNIKNGIAIGTATLVLCAIIGLVLWSQPSPTPQTVGKYMLFISLGIICAQIVVGIIYRIVKST